VSRALAVPPISATLVRFAVLKAALAVAGFGRTYRWIRARTLAKTMDDGADPALVARVEYAVAMAAALYPGHAACLERSLMLYWYLGRAGVPARYRMGVQMYPFLAHAWVEYRGVPINDVPEHVRLFQPIEGVDA
jgi:hypothetical protein